jgi:hypothetical protein
MEISKQLHAPAAFGKDGWRNSGVVARKWTPVVRFKVRHGSRLKLFKMNGWPWYH